MRPLTDTWPKPLLSAGGKPLIQYHIEALAAAGIHDIVINLAWKGEMLRDALGDGSRFGVHLHFVDEGAEALETGGGVLNALPLLGETFVVVSGDVWTRFPFATLRGRLDAADVAHFVLVPNPSFKMDGDFSLRGGRIGNDERDRYTYANIGIFRARFFDGCTPGRFPIAPLMRKWAMHDRVSGELYSGPWRNIGTPSQLADLDGELSSAS